MSDEEKIQEKVQPKKQTSYTYWVDKNNKSKDLPQRKPQKIQVPLKVESKNSQNPSPWNTIGTWQEKAVPMNEFKKKVETQINQWLLTTEQKEHELSDVDLDGEIQMVFKRGKKNIMYELKGSISFKKEESKGKLKIQQLTDHGDREYKIKGDSLVKEWVAKNAQTLMKIVQGQLQKYKA